MIRRTASTGVSPITAAQKPNEEIRRRSCRLSAHFEFGLLGII